MMVKDYTKHNCIIFCTSFPSFTPSRAPTPVTCSLSDILLYMCMYSLCVCVCVVAYVHKYVTLNIRIQHVLYVFMSIYNYWVCYMWIWHIEYVMYEDDTLTLSCQMVLYLPRSIISIHIWEFKYAAICLTYLEVGHSAKFPTLLLLWSFFSFFQAICDSLKVRGEGYAVDWTVRVSFLCSFTSLGFL